MADSIQPSELRKYSFDELDSKMIHDAAKNGDTIALRAFEQTGKITWIQIG